MRRGQVDLDRVPYLQIGMFFAEVWHRGLHRLSLRGRIPAVRERA